MRSSVDGFQPATKAFLPPSLNDSIAGKLLDI